MAGLQRSAYLIDFVAITSLFDLFTSRTPHTPRLWLSSSEHVGASIRSESPAPSHEVSKMFGKTDATAKKEKADSPAVRSPW